MKILHKDKLVHEFLGNESPEEILEWVQNKWTIDGHIIFGDKNYWKLSFNKDKIMHETMVSYTELDLI